ncbi:MAG: hypothetical protein AAEJ04_10110 [Planctomycetota bacterium]
MISINLNGRKNDFILSVLVLLVVFSSGCRQAERIEKRRDLPLRAWNRDLYDSEGIQVYASSTQAAREIATIGERAAESFRKKTGEEPRQILFIAVDSSDPVDQDLLEAGIQGLARVSGKPIPDLETSIRKEAQRKGTQGIEGEEKVLQAMLGMIPGILEAPPSRPAELWKDAVVIPTSKRVDSGVNDIIQFFMEREELNTFQRILLTPIVAIAKRYVSKILGSVQEAIVLGVHAQERDGWPQEKIEQLIKDTLEESGFKELGADIVDRSQGIREPQPEPLQPEN